MQFKKLGFATFEGGPTFWRSLLSGFTSGQKFFWWGGGGGGGRYFRGVVTIGTLRYIKRVVYCGDFTPSRHRKTEETDKCLKYDYRCHISLVQNSFRPNLI